MHKVMLKFPLCLTKHHIMKTHLGVEVWHHALTWTLYGGWVVRFTSWPLSLWGKSPRYPLDGRLGAPHSLSGRGDKEEKSLPPPGVDPQSSSP